MAALEPAIDLYGAPKAWASQAGLYRLLLGDLPPDLLAEGMVAAMRRCVFFPKPAEIRAAVTEELAHRQHVCRRLAAALGQCRHRDGRDAVEGRQG